MNNIAHHGGMRELCAFKGALYHLARRQPLGLVVLNTDQRKQTKPVSSPSEIMAGQSRRRQLPAKGVSPRL